MSYCSLYITLPIIYFCNRLSFEIDLSFKNLNYTHLYKECNFCLKVGFEIKCKIILQRLSIKKNFRSKAIALNISHKYI